MTKSKNVVISLELSGTSGKRHLSGILRYVNEGHPWNIRIIGSRADFNNQIVTESIRHGTDGFLCIPNRNAAEALRVAPVPVAILDYPTPGLYRRRKSIAIITGDEIAIGALGAKYFQSQGGFASYGFLPATGNPFWSRLRERGYRHELAHQHQTPAIYHPGICSLGEWLQMLTKPAAILAAYDFLAIDIIQECKKLGFDVPRQVSVLGIDNDEIICERTSPALSSIRLDHEESAYALAQTLDRMMRSRHPLDRIHLTTSFCSVTERESTTCPTNSASLVRRAQNFIRENATQGISSRDVIAHLRISKSLAYSVFSKATGTSIHEAIVEERLKDVTRRLLQGGLSIAKISHLAGYRNPQRLKYVFKARFGCSMSEWKRRNIRHGQATSHGN